MSALVGTNLAALQADVLSRALREVPYNSASQYLEYFAGRPPPDRFGMSCAFQSFWVGAQVVGDGGAGPSYYRDGRHRAAVWRENGVLTVLDPYLLHTEPLRLAEADADDTGTVHASCDAYPFRSAPDGTPRPSSLGAAWDTGSGAVRLTYTRHSPRRGHQIVSRMFTVVPEPAPTTVPPPAEAVRPLLLHPEQNNLSLRVVHSDRPLMSEVVLPLRDVRAVNADTARLMVGKDNDGVVSPWGSPEFTRDLEHVAEAVGCEAGEVVEHLLDAAAAYVGVAPADRDLAAYSLEAE